MLYKNDKEKVIGPASAPRNYISSSYARWQMKIRKISIFFIPVVILSVLVFSVVISALDAHDGLILSRDCPLCKLVLDFAFGTVIAVCALTSPDFTCVSFVPERLILIIEILVFSLGTRGPPLSFPITA
jgi:hypothetical protein